MSKQPFPTTEPPTLRRKLAEAYHKLSTGRRFKPSERREFAAMAERWANTLPEKK